jgi:hypothetical protein
MPTERQKVVLAQLLAQGASDKFAIVTDGLEAIPAELAALAEERILADGSGGKAKELLKALSDEVAAAELTQASSLSQEKGYYKVENWASGGAPFRRFKKGALTEYVDELFAMVAGILASVTGEPPEKIVRRHDLFHGHWVFSDAAKDILIVFHAKEYPENLEQFKALAAKALEGANYAAFASADRRFKLRCPIWSMKQNKLFSTDFSAADNPYRELLDSTDLGNRDNPLLLSQTNLGVCIADVNCFSNEGVPSFFRAW